MIKDNGDTYTANGPIKVCIVIYTIGIIARCINAVYQV